MAMIPAERFVFPDLTVLENLRLGARGLSAAEGARRIDAAYADYPVLKLPDLESSVVVKMVMQ